MRDLSGSSTSRKGNPLCGFPSAVSSPLTADIESTNQKDTLNMQIASTPVAAVLEAAAPTTEKTPLERVATKATNLRNRPKMKAVIKPAAPTLRPVAKTKAPKLVSLQAAQIVQACILLGLETKPFGSGSYVIRMPSVKAYIAQQPEAGATESISLFVRTFKALESLTGDAKATWVIHPSGSFALYSRMS